MNIWEERLALLCEYVKGTDKVYNDLLSPLVSQCSYETDVLFYQFTPEMVT